ncbi:carboxymuconolactone decarboxylase family protein [Urbifossiella limnaea]|uniref:Carboxymuconolactone decarboxylase family protein n=1 Tax=Urbifossiella limnaea TaxID=2528023 RepID=A0A517XPA8_9BACT|nr:peroxidase-related enzyme [Urbifossiella limnaea]QDU19335.1 Carboxymuconolactone decarboxylase family protein [Urbifossiella limnaea]
MPHVSLPGGQPGIIGLLAAFRASERPLNDLANAVMHGPSTLTAAERELIAAFVSRGNECEFCCNSHAAAARHLYGPRAALVDAVLADPAAADLDDEMRALLAIAAKVRRDGRLVTADDVRRARDAGADDRAIHDTVLIAAMFSMFNRYVDGLATVAPADPAVYDEIGARIATKGYGSQFRTPAPGGTP